MAKLRLVNSIGSGRAIAFCLGRPGLNLGTDLGFFQFRIVVNLTGCWFFKITFSRTAHSLPSSFLFPIIIYHFKISQLKSINLPRKRKINPKRGRERPIFKKSKRKFHSKNSNSSRFKLRTSLSRRDSARSPL